MVSFELITFAQQNVIQINSDIDLWENSSPSYLLEFTPFMSNFRQEYFYLQFLTNSLSVMN